jgi:putative oxidoreductase
MANVPYPESRRHLSDHELSVPLAERVAGGGLIWLLARIIVGGVFVMSGSQKLMGLDRFAASLVRNGIPENLALILAPLGAGVETLGGLCIVVGFVTSWASLLMILFTLTAAFIGHRFWQFEGLTRGLQQSNFTKNVMIAAAFCLLYVAGGGPYSIDRWWRQRS